MKCMEVFILGMYDVHNLSVLCWVAGKAEVYFSVVWTRNCRLSWLNIVITCILLLHCRCNWSHKELI